MPVGPPCLTTAISLTGGTLRSPPLLPRGAIMASHESIAQSDEWYTPEWIFDALGIQFDLDPCSSGNDFVPARVRYNKCANGLEAPWFGSVWLNPPFGKRNGILPWLERLAEHGDGIAVVPNRTATDWFQDIAKRADARLFVRGKIKFIKPDGSEGKSPGYGNVLLAFGDDMAAILRQSRIPGMRA